MHTQTLAYLYYAHILPVAQQPRLLDNGNVAASGTISALPVLPAFLPACISACSWLDHRTLLLFVDLDHPYDIIHPPGCHMVVNVGGIVRELSPLPSAYYSVYRNSTDRSMIGNQWISQTLLVHPTILSFFIRLSYYFFSYFLIIVYPTDLSLSIQLTCHCLFNYRIRWTPSSRPHDFPSEVNTRGGILRASATSTGNDNYPPYPYCHCHYCHCICQCHYCNGDCHQCHHPPYPYCHYCHCHDNQYPYCRYPTTF